MTKISTTVAGIDTAKNKLDIAVHGRSACWQVENSLHGWRRIAAELAKAGVARVGIEATGGYERGVVKYLRAAGFMVLVLQPIQVRAFARAASAPGQERCARCGSDRGLYGRDRRRRASSRMRGWPTLADHLTFVEQIEEDIARLKTRLEHIDDARLRRLVMADIARLKARRAAELVRIVRSCGPMTISPAGSISCSASPASENAPRSRSSSACPNSAASAANRPQRWLALRPFDDDSGKYKGQRHIAGGRGRLRRSLYAAALPAAFRWNKALDRSLRSPHRTRKSPQCRSCRLRQETLDLR